MDLSNVKHVILSGGTGSRLWPLSRKSCPKQYLEIFEGKSLFQLCIERNKFLNKTGIVVGNLCNYEVSRNIINKIEGANYQEIVEVFPRNTAPAIAFAAMASDPESILLVTPSDHLIEDPIAYQKAVEKAVELASDNLLVTFGITPSHPETGYGYIQVENGIVKRFKEKPKIESARIFLEMGDHFWNSGMFCFKAEVLLNELEFYKPELFKQLTNAFNHSINGFIQESDNLSIDSISIDYAIMENSEKLVMVEGDFKWSDLGSFEALSDYLCDHRAIEEDEFGNVYIGKTRHASFLGVTNMIFVETPDAFLIMDRSSSQSVKGLFEQFERENPNLVN
ncbi:MAG: mannose-1-phosphate guanylyltransferase [Bacteroidota bacterium]